MLKFAYGSNMSSAFLQRVVPSAQAVGRAEVLNYRVEFPYYSETYQGGLSGLTPAPGERTWGVLYRIADDEVAKLDRFQAGDDEGYTRKPLWVIDDSGELQLAQAYLPTNPAGPFEPSLRYVGLMVAGAKEHGLPTQYVARFERTLEPAKA